MDEKPWTLEEAQTYWMLTFPTLHDTYRTAQHSSKHKQPRRIKTSSTVTPDVVVAVTRLLADIHAKIVATDKTQKAMSTSIDFFLWIVTAEKLTPYDFAITVEQDSDNAIYSESCLYSIICASCSPQVLKKNIRSYVEAQKLLAKTLQHKNCSKPITLAILEACQRFSDHNSWLYYRHGASLLLPGLVVANMFNDPDITMQSIMLCQKTADQIFTTLKSALKEPAESATFNLYQNLDSVYLRIAENMTANGTVVAEKLLSPNIANTELSTAIIQRSDVTLEFLDSIINKNVYPSEVVEAIRLKRLVVRDVLAGKGNL